MASKENYITPKISFKFMTHPEEHWCMSFLPQSSFIIPGILGSHYPSLENKETILKSTCIPVISSSKVRASEPYACP